MKNDSYTVRTHARIGIVVVADLAAFYTIIHNPSPALMMVLACQCVRAAVAALAAQRADD